ncbi:MAG: GpE family phage tail protein [Candidatus Accumulibacter sp.]|nr:MULTISPECIES: GpE family phage tail protein [Betaproteobacteria]MBN8438455.1 GpE family phage tail protein [Accumulibacter sp.]MBN8473163.1 GpE family phage tail protein [Sulfuritalea sp.]
MADIAIAFHWPPSAMNDMSIEELSAWRERARVRLGGEE